MVNRNFRLDGNLCNKKEFIMKTRFFKQKGFVFILVTILMVTFGTQNISYAQEGDPTITASVEAPLTEATLSGSVVTLTLSGSVYTQSEFTISRALTVSGIGGVTFDSWDVDRVSDTKVTVELTFSGNIDTDTNLVFTVGAGGIADYRGAALAAHVPVMAVDESLVASTELSLTEVTLHGSVVVLTLSGRSFNDEWDVSRALTISGIDGVAFDSWDVDRVSDTKVTVELTFSGNIDTDTPLVFTVGAGGIADYDGAVLTAQVPVTAVEESLVATTEIPLTEATLHGSVVTLTLSGRVYARSPFDIQDAVSVSGIDGVTFDSFFDIDRVSNTEVTVKLSFFGNFDEDSSLTITVGADAIAGYPEGFTVQLPVTAVEESITASTEFPLTEATLDGSVVKLTLNGRYYEGFLFDVRDAVSVSGIDGVSISRFGINRVSNIEGEVRLSFDGTDFDTDGVLTFTVGADAIAGYGDALTAQIPITAVKQSNATVSLLPNPVVSAPIGGQITLSLTISGGENVAGYQALVWHDVSTLRYVESSKGNYLPMDAYFISTPPPEEDDDFLLPGIGMVETTLSDAGNGNGTLATLTFEVIAVKSSTLTLSEVYLVDSDGERWEAHLEDTVVIEPPHRIFGDVNRDGVVNVQDLIFVSVRFGLRGENSADVNGDGIVDIVDLVLVGGAFGAKAAAPPLNSQILELLTATDVKGWLTQAQQLSLTDPAYLRGITVLEQLHKALTPKKTALLPNFPNPFNPETWIPYHLSKDADVTLHIYAMNGTLVRTLTLGHQAAGRYQSRSRAAYWDGKNEFGEKVASGLYFYTLTVGEFTATRKMLILK